MSLQEELKDVEIGKHRGIYIIILLFELIKYI